MAAAENGLSIRGYVDRTTVEQGVEISITAIVANTGDKEAKNCSVEIIPGSLACKPTDFALGPKEEQAVSCKLTLRDEGQLNVVALASWKETAAAPDGSAAAVSRTTGQLISEVRVSSLSWFKRPELQVFAWLTLVILFLLWRLRRYFLGADRSFSWVVGALVIASSIALVSGIQFHDGALGIAGLVLLFVAALLMIQGEKATKRLLSRLHKAGPLEFWVTNEKTKYFAVVDAGKNQFLQPKTLLDLALTNGNALSRYLDLYRLKMYVIESRLTPLNPRVPESGVARKVWFESLASQYTATLDKASSTELKTLYRSIEGYEKLKKLFDESLSNLLKEAKAAKEEEERNTKVEDAITLLADFRKDASAENFVPPTCLVILAHLKAIVETEEAAFSMLYQAQSDAPESLVSNYMLCFYLMDVANDSYTALRYGDLALKAVQELEKFPDWEGACAEVSGAKGSAFADHLRDRLDPYRGHKNKELKDWLQGLRPGVENDLAYLIATLVLVYREGDAKRYAKAAVDFDSNTDYLDTLALVMLNFGIANRDRREVREGWKLFTRVAREFDHSASAFERELNRVHLERASVMLSSADDWDE